MRRLLSSFSSKPVTPDHGRQSGRCRRRRPPRQHSLLMRCSYPSSSAGTFPFHRERKLLSLSCTARERPPPKWSCCCWRCYCCGHYYFRRRCCCGDYYYAASSVSQCCCCCCCQWSGRCSRHSWCRRPGGECPPVELLRRWSVLKREKKRLTN